LNRVPTRAWTRETGFAMDHADNTDSISLGESTRPLVLVVDDDDGLRDALRDLLDDAGFATVGARDGLEALAVLGALPSAPSFILLDLKMPRMDGLQVLAKMKQDPRTRAIPVVMMTSSREEGDLIASYRLGVNSYVVKPVDFDAFAEMVAEVGMYWMISNQTVS